MQFSHLCKIFGLATLIAVAGCKDESGDSPSLKLYNEGRAIYAARCTACHNPEPHSPGPIGPDVFGSSRELIEARVLRAQYPENYKAKRDTKMMLALPDLKDKIDSLAAFLNDKK